MHKNFHFSPVFRHEDKAVAIEWASVEIVSHDVGQSKFTASHICKAGNIMKVGRSCDC